jgi:hypothetical protein
MRRHRIPGSLSTPLFLLLALSTAAMLLRPELIAAQAAPAKHFPLLTADGLYLNNVQAEPVTLQGKKGLKLVVSEEAKQKYAHMNSQERANSPLAQHARLEGVEFSNGTITAEIAGEPAPDAGASARGFVGIAFRMQQDPRYFDCFYLRPTNGRADDQERRNHAVQYQMLPDWIWSRLRSESPGKYESYVDLETGVWTKIKIEVHGDKARLYVHDQQQPTLIVNDVKSGPNGKGAVALWLEPGTIAHFRDVTVTPEAGTK